MIQYSNQLISADIPAPPNVEDLRYVDEPPEFTFATGNQDAIVDFYRKALAAAGWKSTMDKMVDVDGKPTMIFRNPAKEMITLSIPYVLARQAWWFGSFSKRDGNRRARSQMKEEGAEAPRRSRSESSERGEGSRRVGRKKQGAESRRHTARGCERREADQRLDQVHCRQRKSQSGHRIFADTVSRRGLERRKSPPWNAWPAHSLFSKKEAERDHHL